MSSIARLAPLVRHCICKTKNSTITSVRKATSGTGRDPYVVYRDQPRWHPNYILNSSVFIIWVATSWMGINMYLDPDHWLFGEGNMPSPSSYTDEELGIPPDDEDIYPPGYIPLKDRK